MVGGEEFDQESEGCNTEGWEFSKLSEQESWYNWTRQSEDKPQDEHSEKRAQGCLAKVGQGKSLCHF